MPKIGGFELLAALPAPRPFEVIFATASDRYAIRAFEENALDYLLKPYDQARMQQALDRVVERRQGSTPTVGNPGLERLLSMHTALSTERLTVRTDEGWVAIPVEKITRLSAADKYVVISCEGKNHVARGALRTLHERLDPTLFFRVHRGDVVALSAVARIESKDHGDAVLVLHDGETVPLSRTHRSKFLAAFKT
jgi:two-component system LytT family response regulator